MPSWLLALIYIVAVLFFLTTAIDITRSLMDNYIYATLMTGLLIGPTVTSKFVYPYLVSPRRWYARYTGALAYPWVPPDRGTSGVVVHALLLAYLLALNSTVCRLFALRDKGRVSEGAIWALTRKLTAVQFLALVAVRVTPFLNRYMRAAPVPFVKDLSVGLAMAVVSAGMMWWSWRKELGQQTR